MTCGILTLVVSGPWNTSAYPVFKSAMFCICGGGSTVSETSALIISASLIIGATNNDIICLPFSCMIFAVSFQVSIFGVVAQSNMAC